MSGRLQTNGTFTCVRCGQRGLRLDQVDNPNGGCDYCPDDPSRCARCDEPFEKNDEMAEVAAGSIHVIIHASCMLEGEQIA